MSSDLRRLLRSGPGLDLEPDAVRVRPGGRPTECATTYLLAQSGLATSRRGDSTTAERKRRMAEDGSIQFIAIIGGLYNLDPTEATAAKDAGRLVGQELAQAGFGLVVYFSNDHSLEPHVVSGYIAAGKSGSHNIRVRYAQSQRGQVRFSEEADHPECFEHRLFPGEDWEAPFYQSLAEAEGVDGVLLLAGGTSTLIAGHIAVARKLPILAVDQFGGSAAKIWAQLAQASPQRRLGSWGTHPPAKLVGDFKAECQRNFMARAEARQREQVLDTISAQRQRSIWAAGAFVALLIALYLGFVYKIDPASYPIVMLAGLVAAGATGSLVRTVIAGPIGSDARTSLVLGSIAGFVVGLAYLIPQWVGAPGVLEAKGSDVSANDKIQFASVILVALSAGVGFDTVFSRLREQAQEIPIGPPRI